MRLNRAAITPEIQRTIAKRLNLNSAKLRQYKAIVGKSGDEHSKFLIQTKLLKGNMTQSQIAEALTKLSEVTNNPKLRNAKSSLKSILDSVNKVELEKIKEEKAKIIKRGVDYRKNLRIQLNAVEKNPLVKTAGTVFKTASQMPRASINATGSSEEEKAAEKQASIQQVSPHQPAPPLPQMPLD